ncbi:hypothetical protein C823_000368 [Eubacterium plexicaudatum ASF492]|uniref:Uncharacterized protein n=1 Tax=Eubacterium plexicaudatum ASF492 TaxID=1235802 RepID=N2A6F1_9FIRM|nr:hypothetical protein C823_000368 [Eubacterium plexicaudatum ASF492]
MIIDRVSDSIKALAAAVNPHKEAVELAEQQIDELADDLVRDTYETTMKPDDYVYPSENYNDIMKVSATEHSSSSNNNRQPQ